MAKDPAVLFYTSDFLSGVSFLTMEQRGQYITLLCEQHQHWSIPKNHMIAVCGTLDSPVIEKFVQDDEGNYYNERMRDEGEKRKNFCKSRSNNKSGRKSKKSYDKSYDKSHDNHMENENENDNKVLKNKKCTKEFAAPQIGEVKLYFIENGYCEQAAIKAFNYYNVANWYDSKGTKIKNWKQKMQGVWFKPENKIKQEDSSLFTANGLPKTFPR